jgi:hypothetical protein
MPHRLREITTVASRGTLSPSGSAGKFVSAGSPLRHTHVSEALGFRFAEDVEIAAELVVYGQQAMLVAVKMPAGGIRLAEGKEPHAVVTDADLFRLQGGCRRPGELGPTGLQRVAPGNQQVPLVILGDGGPWPASCGNGDWGKTDQRTASPTIRGPGSSTRRLALCERQAACEKRAGRGGKTACQHFTAGSAPLENFGKTYGFRNDCRWHRKP